MYGAYRLFGPRWRVLPKGYLTWCRSVAGIVSLLCVVGCGSAQEDSTDVNRVEAAEQHADEDPRPVPDYDTASDYDPVQGYDPAQKEPFTAEEWRAIAEREPFERRAAREQKDRSGPAFDFSGFAEAAGTIAWVLVVALLLAGLGYAVWRYRRRPDLRTSGRDYGTTDTLLASTPEALATELGERIEIKDFSVAIRLRFGQLLQELRARRLLVWVPGHTNHDYERALPTQLRDGFRELAQEFAYATYAGREIEEARYRRFSIATDAYLVTAQPAASASVGTASAKTSRR